MNPSDKYPLSWHGGKRMLAPVLAARLEPALQTAGRFVEPFAGGAAVALTLLGRNPDLRVRLNDADRPVYAFWATVQAEVEFLVARVRRGHPERATWRRYRAELGEGRDDLPLPELAWRLWAVKAWSFNHKGGTFQTNQAQRIDGQIARLRAASRLLRKAAITQRDFREALADDDGVAYLDPPYLVATEKGRYYDHPFSAGDHLDLRRALLRRQSAWLLSYDDRQEIHEWYVGCRIEPVSVPNNPHRHELIVGPCP